MNKAAAPTEVGHEQVRVIPNRFEVLVQAGLDVHWRIYDDEGRQLVSLATTPERAVNLAKLLMSAALRANPALAEKAVIPGGKP